MGGGASKQPEKASTAAPAATSNAANPTQPPADTEPAVVKGLTCTVQEATKNSLVPFQSSVKNSDQQLAPSPSSTASPDAADLVFHLGDVAVSTSEFHPKVVNPKAPASPLSPGTSSPSFSKATFSNGNAKNNASPTFVGPQRFGSFPVQFPPSEEKVAAVGDMKLAKDMYLTGGDDSFSTTHTDKLFARRTPYATPVNYTFTPCGGQCGPIRSLSSSADGSQFAVAVAGNKHCFLVDGNTGRNIMSIRGHLDPVLSCAHSRDSKFLVTASADCTVILWDLNNGKKLREIPVSYQANVCAVSDDSDVIATTSTEDFVHMWEAKSCDPLVNFQRHSASIFSLGFSRRGQLFASGSTNGEIFVWNHVTGDVRFLFARHRTPVLAVSFSQDGQRLVSIDRESVRMWDLFTGHCVFCRDTKGKIIVGSDDIEEREQINHDDSVRFTSCCFVAGNLVLCSTTAKQVLLLEPNTGGEILSIPTRGVVTSFATNWVGDIIFIGDFLGNHHKLQLHFSAKDVVAFNLNAKLVTKDKSSRLEKD